MHCFYDDNDIKQMIIAMEQEEMVRITWWLTHVDGYVNYNNLAFIQQSSGPFCFIDDNTSSVKH